MELMEDSLTVCPHCGYDEEMTDERLDQLKPGSLLKERFTIGRPLGRGGFGITYIAWDNSLQRKVAIKEYLPRGLASREPGNTTVSYDSETKEAFLRGVDKTLEESRRLAGFTELESVVNVYDCFKENGTAYIVMEVLKGENAKKRLERAGVFSFDETVRIMTPVLETLEKVHKTGIIHRDISPDNIYICDNGKVKLLDFGSARIADNTDEKSRSIVLKHGYAPKEQYTAKGKQGPFTDIYSVCATIYKMLTGVTPVESLERINDEDELQDISELVKIPSPAAKAIMKGMAVNASDRIQSAGELLAGLTSKEPDKPANYDDYESTVTLYVPQGAASSVPDEPVQAAEMLKTAVPAKADSVNNSKADQGKKKSPVIKIVAIIAALAIVIGAVAIAFRHKPDPTPTSIPDQVTTTTTATRTATESNPTPSDPKILIDEKLWKPEFRKFFDTVFRSDNYEMAEWAKIYIVDIDGDSVPEIIDQTQFWIPTVDYYNIETDSVSDIMIPVRPVDTTEFGKSPNKLYIDRENHCLIVRCEGDYETMQYAFATIYSFEDGEIEEEDIITIDIDLSNYDMSSKVGKEKAYNACKIQFEKQFEKFVEGRKLEDFENVSVKGSDAVLKKLNSEFAENENLLTTVPTTAPLQFDVGHISKGKYINEWAQIQFAIPNQWNIGESGEIDAGKKNDEFKGGYRFSKDKNYVSICIYEGNVNDIISRFGTGGSRSNKTLAGSEWIASDQTVNPNLGLLKLRENQYTSQYFKQIDDYVIFIEIYSEGTDNRETYGNGFSEYYPE